MAFESWWTDVRLAARNAARQPGFTLLVSLTLALGLGVNTAVFALIDAALLRPLPYKDPARLVYVWQTLPKHNVFEVEATPFDYDAWHRLESLSGIAMLSYGSYSLTGGTADPERVRGARMTASLMPLVGITPALGRGFTSAEDLDDAPAVAILGDGLWRRRYGSDPGIVGRTIEIDGTTRTVVGIMPRRALLPGRVGEENDLWLPMRLTASERVNESSHNYTIVARLADSVSLAHASTELDLLAARMTAERRSHTGIGARLVPLAESAVRGVRPGLFVAAASVALLLLVATANASTLLIARAANRRHELAVRAALGATRGRLLALSIADGLLLAMIGAGAALMLGRWTLAALIPLFADSLPAALAVGLDARGVVFALTTAVVIGLIFGVAASYRPATRLADSFAGGRRSTTSASVGRTRNLLVVAQIALAVVLLSAAGLMLNTMARLARVSPGFSADHLLTFKITLTGSRYDTAPQRIAAVSSILDRVGTLPGVRSAGIVSVVPFGGIRNADVVQIEGYTPTPGEASMIIDQRYVSPEYFRTIGIPLVSGRYLSREDNGQAERVVLINRAMARQRFSNEVPLNRRVRVSGESTWLRIVGVVDDVRHLGLTREPVAEMYHPIAQVAVPTLTVVVRTVADPSAMTPSARAAVRAVDSNLPIYEIRTMDERIAASIAQTRVTMLLLVATAALAAALAAVAIYGAIWYAVVQQTPEIGIRVALGASRASVFRGVVSRAVVLAGVGALLGCAGGLAAGALMRSLLFDTSTTDPSTFAAVIGSVMALATLASLVPAIRATRIDPIVALRGE